MEKSKKIVCKKSLNNSLNFIEKFECEDNFKVYSSDPNLDKSKASTYIKDGSFYIGLYANKILNQNERNELHHSDVIFTLKNKNRNLVFDFKSFSHISTPITENPSKFNCKVSKYLNQEITEERKRYFRLIIPTKKRLMPAEILESNSVQVDNIKYLFGLISIKYFHLSFHLYTHSIKSEKKHYFIIESRKKTNLTEFNKNIDNILLAYAFITGYYPREKRYILSADDNYFDKTRGILYETLGKSYVSHNSVFPPSNIRIYFNLPHSIHFPENIFNKLCLTLFSKEILSRVLYLIVEGNTLSVELRASIYSVALESVTNIISEENKSKFLPISKKEDSKIIIKELNEIINKHADKFKHDGQETVKKKIAVINSPTNKQKLLKPFEILNLELNQEEIEAINKRNEFLHGRNEYRYNNEEDKFNLEQITSRLLYCVTIIVLKYIGYSGYVMYYPTLNEF